jgi:hypothetical protein
MDKPDPIPIHRRVPAVREVTVLLLVVLGDRSIVSSRGLGPTLLALVHVGHGGLRKGWGRAATTGLLRL